MYYTYRKLCTRIEQLDKKLLSRRSADNSRNQDFIKSFILLSHAEIEEYIEGIAEKKTIICERLWKTKKCANYNTACIFMTYNKIGVNILTSGCNAIKNHMEKINNNNGIRRHNLESLFQPLGFNVSNFDTSMVANLETLGMTRGSCAHQSNYSILT